MNTECSICYDNKIIVPCGAFNNCSSSVCNDCFYRCSDELNYMSYKCVYCKTYNYKRGLIDELNDVWESDSTNYHFKQYILWVMLWKHNKNILLLDPFDDDDDDDFSPQGLIPCLPCDDE